MDVTGLAIRWSPQVIICVWPVWTLRLLLSKTVTHLLCRLSISTLPQLNLNCLSSLWYNVINYLLVNACECDLWSRLNRPVPHKTLLTIIHVHLWLQILESIAAKLMVTKRGFTLGNREVNVRSRAVLMWLRLHDKKLPKKTYTLPKFLWYNMASLGS